MWKSITIATLLLSTGIVRAQSPPGVFPQVPNLILAAFGDHMVGGGDNLSPGAVTGLPQIGLPANQSQTGNRYMLMIVDLDYNPAKRKRQISDQPDDTAHASGQGTYLNALIQDYEVSGASFGDNAGKLLQQSNSKPAAYIPPSPNSGSNNRYMMLLFDQPLGFQLPSSLSQLVSIRTNFDIKNFINVANLGMPRYGNWFIVNGGSAASGNSAVSGSSTINGSSSPSISVADGGSASMATGQSVAASSTGSAIQSQETFFSTSTLPSGGPTLTFQYTTLIGATPASTATVSPASTQGGNTQSGTPTTLTFMTTTTMPNGGPTATYLTTSVGVLGGGQVCVFNSANICNQQVTTYYTTGFIGFTVLSSESVSVFQTTTMSNGQLTSYQTSSTTTYTRAFSGVPEISLSTFIARTTLVTTGTAYINGELTTYTSTTTSVGPTTSAAPVFNAAATAAPGRYVGPAMVALAGAVVAVL